jgi:hypothetical protein
MKKLLSIAILGTFVAVNIGCSDSKPAAKPAETKPADSKEGPGGGRVPPK